MLKKGLDVSIRSFYKYNEAETYVVLKYTINLSHSVLLIISNVSFGCEVHHYCKGGVAFLVHEHPCDVVGVLKLRALLLRGDTDPTILQHSRTTTVLSTLIILMSAPQIPNLNTLRRGGGLSRLRGRGGSGYPTHRYGDDGGSKDRPVQQTDNDASISRLSAVDLGYLWDPFSKVIIGNAAPSRRYPIINRGPFSHC